MKNSANRILTIAVILLLLLNIAMVVYIIKQRSHPKPPRGGNPMEMMDKELNMTEQQKAEVKKLRDEHFETIHPLFDSIRSAKVAYFGLIKDPNVNDSMLNVYNTRMNDLQSKINKLTFDHFRSVKAVLSEEQQRKYDDFVQKMMQRKKDSTGKKK